MKVYKLSLCIHILILNEYVQLPPSQYTTIHILGQELFPESGDRDLKKVKFSHRPTRYRALDPELIPVYKQSARR